MFERIMFSSSRMNLLLVYGRAERKDINQKDYKFPPSLSKSCEKKAFPYWH